MTFMPIISLNILLNSFQSKCTEHVQWFTDIFLLICSHVCFEISDGFDLIFLPYVHDPSTMLCLALPANGDLDRDGLPLISCLAVLSAIHCSAGFTLDTSEVYISDINQCLRNARHVCLPKPWPRWR